jgi:hypothetical protein
MQIPRALHWCCLAALSCVISAPAEKGRLRAGAARVEITPPEDAALPMSGYAGRTDGYAGVHDPLYFRAIVVDDGERQAALVAGDTIAIPHAVWEALAPRISKETGIARDYILISGTHTHGAPSPTPTDGKNPKLDAYLAGVHDKIVGVVKQAQSKLQPARIGAGAGEARVNMNRRARTAEGGWWLGYNPDGPSDKTVHVVKFETLDGKALALYVNYSVHGTVMGPRNMLVTADLPGATSRFVESELGGDVVVPWTSGAAGDQNPIYRTEEAFGGRIGSVDILGRILGEEVIRVAKTITTSERTRISALQREMTCPGKKADPVQTYRGPGPHSFLDADPVMIRLSGVRIGDAFFGGVSGEVMTKIDQRLKAASPLKHTLMVTHTNGSSGYFADDAAYGQVSYEIVTTRAKRGCAEAAIADGLLGILDEL